MDIAWLHAHQNEMMVGLFVFLALCGALVVIQSHFKAKAAARLRQVLLERIPDVNGLVESWET